MPETTDLEKFIALYAGVGIPLEAEPWGENGEQCLDLRAGDHPRIEGHLCFYTTIVFDKDGKFVSQGIWE